MIVLASAILGMAFSTAIVLICMAGTDENDDD